MSGYVEIMNGMADFEADIGNPYSGKSAYQYAVEAGYVGTPEEFATMQANMANYAKAAQEAASQANSALAQAKTATQQAQEAAEKAETMEASIQKIRITDCEYSKRGTVHALVTDNPSVENIKFFATASYQRGDSFTLNGNAVSVKTLDGQSPDTGYFRENVMVYGMLKDSVLYFTGRSDVISDDTDVRSRFKIGIENGYLYMEDV